MMSASQAIMVLQSRRGLAAAVFLAVLAALIAVNSAVAFLLHHAGLQTGVWDLHFWAIFPGGNTPSWMPVDDSWSPMRKAYDWFTHPHEGMLYQNVFFSQHVKFQYPPSSLLVFAIPEGLGLTVSNRFLNWIGWFAVLTEAAATGTLAFVAARGQQWARSNPQLRLACAVAAGLAVFSFHSVLWAFSLGQIQAWLNALFALAAIAFLCGRERTAGVLVGLMCLIKPQFGLFVIWAALRGRWQFIVGLAVALAVGLGLSLFWFGIDNHIDYLSAISFMSRHGEAYYPNSSVNAVMNRMLGNADPFTVDKTAFPPFHPIIYYVSLATSMVLVAIALFFRNRNRMADFLAAAIIFTVASPIAWEHHLGILPPIFAFVAISLIGRPRASLPASLLAFAYLAAAVFIPPFQSLASGLPSLVYGLPLAGALVCTGLLLVGDGPLAESRAKFS